MDEPPQQHQPRQVCHWARAARGFLLVPLDFGCFHRHCGIPSGIPSRGFSHRMCHQPGCAPACASPTPSMSPCDAGGDNTEKPFPASAQLQVWVGIRGGGWEGIKGIVLQIQPPNPLIPKGCPKGDPTQPTVADTARAGG